MNVDNEQERRDVRQAVRGRAAHVSERYRQAVHDLGLDVERGEIRQHMIGAARQPGGRLSN